MIKYLGPYQTVCNDWNYFWTYLSEHVSEQTNFGFAQRALINTANTGQPNNARAGRRDRAGQRRRQRLAPERRQRVRARSALRRCGLHHRRG